MINIKSLFLITSVFLSTAATAADNGNIDQKLGSLKLEKMQAEAMVATMVRRGHMDEKDATRIKREIASVKEQDSEVIKAEAIENLNSKNSFATK